MDGSSNQDRIRKKQGTDRFFMPCLLSTLTDLHPEARMENYPRGVSLSQLKDDILLNVSLILNSRSHSDSDAWDGDMEVSKSVVNLGLRDFCGRYATPDSVESVRSEIVRQLQAFEPRLARNSIKVEIVGDGQSTSPTQVQMSISGIIRVDPVNEELVLRSCFDFDTGKTEVYIAD
ncbi:MAG: type VI secretion system baseplate subunit TssE [Victivallaceae bacterium]|nr:type VI secretion system baseplate subunit TssE [Victivallaceae bacterium]